MEPRRGRRPGEQTKIETKLAAWRVKRGMTQEEVASAAGLPLSSYRLHERGKVADPGVITLLRFAYILGCKVTDLIEDHWEWAYQRKAVAGSGRNQPKPPNPRALWRNVPGSRRS